MKKNLLTAFLFTAFYGYSTVYYVDASKTNNNLNGLSWATAKKDLQEALNLAVTGDEIWVKQGTYYPTKNFANNPSPSDLRTRNFHFNTMGISIYGGFIGNETDKDQADPENNSTILSGDFNNDDTLDTTGSTLSGFANTNENAYHILVIASVTAPCEINGFTFKGGQTSMSGTVSDSFLGNTIYRSSGSAINFAGSNVFVKRCKFQKNVSLYGTLCLNNSSNVTVDNCLFDDNFGIWGGAINNQGGTRIVCRNSTFHNNRSSTAGAIWINSGSNNNLIYNSIFWNNSKNGSTTTAGAEISSSGILNVYDSILQSFAGGTNNLLANPLFVDANTSDFRLQTGSPALDSGNNNWVLATTITDIAGNTRIQNTTVDRGAYEGEVLLSTKDFDNYLFSLYPNPVKNILTVESIEDLEEITIYTLAGQKMTLTQGNETIDMSELPKGYYLLKAITNTGKVLTSKVMKE